MAAAISSGGGNQRGDDDVVMEITPHGDRAPQMRGCLASLAIFVAGMAVAVLIVIGPLHWFDDVMTTQSLSPDEKHRIYLVERKPHLPLRIDRNFVVELETLDPRHHGEITRARIFDSPDEGRPIGTERFIWSSDSSYVLLVGKHFYVSTELPTPEGEQAYFLYHLPTGRWWCNAQQAAGKDGPLTSEQLSAIDFVAPVLQ